MKLRTVENLIDFLNEDIAWRKKELSSLKNNILQANVKLRLTAIRAGVVLLYAHWEGFIKRSAEAYLNLGKMYEKTNDVINALKNFKQAYTLGGGNNISLLAAEKYNQLIINQ